MSNYFPEKYPGNVTRDPNASGLRYWLAKTMR